MPNLIRALSLVLVLTLTGCGYNTLQRDDEQISAAWSEVLNQYQRRADLVPNLVNVVKGYAAHEREVLTQVTEARARVGQIQATPELVNDPAAFAKFQAAQRDMSSALARLLVVAENYPQLKADAGFRDLQAQLEGTENRIAVARNRYIKSVQEYNSRCARSRAISRPCCSASRPNPTSASKTNASWRRHPRSTSVHPHRHRHPEVAAGDVAWKPFHISKPPHPNPPPRAGEGMGGDERGSGTIFEMACSSPARTLGNRR